MSHEMEKVENYWLRSYYYSILFKVHVFLLPLISTRWQVKFKVDPMTLCPKDKNLLTASE